jgi:NADH dehydrogenase FAD-containing subunit
MVAGIRRMVAGETAVPFTYRTGMLATIGRNAAVAHIRGVSFHGFPA